MRSGEGFKLKTEMLPGRFSRPGEYRSSYWVPDQTAITDLRQQKFR
jgi:hypothetical protein